MKKKMLSGMLALVVLVGTGLIGYAKGVDDKVGRIRMGEKDLHHCHTVLDACAGTDFGGHREAAEKNIDAALKECDAAIAFRNQALKSAK